MFFAQESRERGRRFFQQLKKISANLVDDVGDGVAGVELDLGEDGLTGSRGRDDGGGSGVANGGSSVAKGSGDGGSGVAKGSSDGKGSGGGWDGEDLTALALSGGWGSGSGSLIESPLELSLGGHDLLGVLNGGGSNEVEDGLGKVDGLGDGDVGSGDTEAKTIGDVVHGLEKSVGIDVAKRKGKK